MKKKLTHRSILLWCCLIVNVISAQIYNAGEMIIHDGGELYVASDSFNFSNINGNTLTSRTANTNGKVSFSATATAVGESNNHFVDGFIKYYGNTSFIAPVGNNNVLAPVRLNPENTSGVEVAYVRENPSTIGGTLGITIETLIPVEYWIVKGTNSSISLSWRSSSNLANFLLSPSLTYITIVGYNGSQWVEIPSFYDTTSFLGNLSSETEGSITTLNSINLNDYTAFALAVKKNASCFPVITSSGITKTWNGTSWSPSIPTLADPVVINQPYTGSLSCYSVALNANYTLNDNQLLDVVEGFSGTGKVIMSSEASVLQRSSSATPPIIELTKITNPMRRFDYTFLSSPLANFATYFADISSANKTAVNGLFGQFSNSAFYNFFTDSNTGASVNVTSSNVPIGRGFSATVRPNQAPYSLSQAAGSWFTQTFPIHIKTEGLTNNGNITVPFPTNTNWGRIGNPYPSPINGEKLLDALNTADFRKTIYFWTFNTPRQNWASNPANYNPADYATFNYTGGVAACATCQEPTGIIPTMQSVYIRKENGSSATSVPLTNCLRDLSGNDIFFRNMSNSNGRIRLNLTGNENSFSQILVAYHSEATLDYDNGLDSPRMGGAITSELNSLLPGQTTAYAIQTRPSFDVSDIVPLQVVKRTNETFTITLVNKDGVFINQDIQIYLHDKLLGVMHNFNEGAYTFIQTAQIDNERFEIVYQNQTLSNPEIIKVNAVAYINEKIFTAQASDAIKEIQIFDVTGRQVETYKNIGNTLIKKPFFHPQAPYIAKIILENGSIVTQKLINVK